MERPIGLMNTEGTCYMNATLQCLNNLEELTNYLLNLKPIVNNTIILEEFINLIKGLKFDKSPYNAKNIREKMEKVNKLFKSHKGNDPSDLILFLFKSLESDLKNLGYNGYKLWFYERINNNENLKEIYDYDIDKTILNELFNYITKETFLCYCQKPKYNYQTEQFMTLNINKDDSIENCINNYKKKYQSKLSCKICEIPYLIKKDIEIYPKYMIIILNPINKYNKYKISFDDFIFVVERNKKVKYLLNGIIVHLGDNSDYGHFWAFCRYKNTDSFYKFNDSSVTNIDFTYIKNYSPYILFYQRTQEEYKNEDTNEDNDENNQIIEQKNYKPTGILKFSLTFGSKKWVEITIDFTTKKIDTRMSKINNNEKGIIINIINGFKNSLFNLKSLEETIAQINSNISKIVNKNS